MMSVIQFAAAGGLITVCPFWFESEQFMRNRLSHIMTEGLVEP